MPINCSVSINWYAHWELTFTLAFELDELHLVVVVVLLVLLVLLVDVVLILALLEFILKIIDHHKIIN